jgi:drug/metabolite transporter (DMT)-like permease
MAASIWAVEPVLARFSSKLSGGETDFLYITTARAFFTMMIGLLYVLIRRTKFHVSKRQFSAIALTALVSSVAADLIYFYCLLIIPALNAVLLGHLQPIFIIVMGYAFLKDDRLTIYDYMGILLMIFAGVLVISRTGDNLLHFNIGSYGDFLVILATILWSAGSVIMRRNIRGLDAGVITVYRFMIATAVYLVFLFIKYHSDLSLLPGLNRYLVILGCLVGLGYILYYEGLRRIKAAQVGAIELAGPVFAALFGFIFLKEHVTLLQIGGIAILFPGIYLLSRRES